MVVPDLAKFVVKDTSVFHKKPERIPPPTPLGRGESRKNTSPHPFGVKSQSSRNQVVPVLGRSVLCACVQKACQKDAIVEYLPLPLWVKRRIRSLRNISSARVSFCGPVPA